jgi:hydroxymethylpyrimidine pyrophosphatase-like HAD family hydrolase
MTITTLAVDYDGTLACDGIVDAATTDGLERARAHGVRLVLVTGRELPSLFDTFDRVALFDRVVAENGAVLYDPASRVIKVLGGGPPPALIEALQRANVPISIGHSIVATVRPHEVEMLAVIRTLRLDWHIVFNKRAVMALPLHVTKATGLVAALDELHAQPGDTVGVGDAENDHTFLRLCGWSVAVSNALRVIKADVDMVTTGERGAGVVEVIDELLSGRLTTRVCARRS